VIRNLRATIKLILLFLWTTSLTIFYLPIHWVLGAVYNSGVKQCGFRQWVKKAWGYGALAILRVQVSYHQIAAS
jgi:hypothetical protein